MKIFSRNVFLLIAGILIIRTAVAQQNYQPAKIFTMNGDTVKGYLDYRNWGNNPYKVRFKTTPESEPRIFKPFDIDGFSVKNEIYVSAAIQRETSPIKTGELEYDPELQLEKDTVFLKAVILGPKSLFYYKNAQEKKDQFYIRLDSQFQLLIFKKYLKGVEQNNTTREIVFENRTYIGQLRVYLTDCPTIQTKLKNLKYDMNHFIKLFHYYYECTDMQIDFEKKIERVKVELGILSGLSIAKVNFQTESDISQFLVNSHFQPSYNYAGAFFTDFVFPRNQRKFSLLVELFYNRYYFTAEYTDKVNEDHYTIYTTQIGYSYIKQNFMLRFKYPVGKTYLFINGGVSLGSAVSGINSLKKYSKFYYDEHTTYQSALAARHLEQSLLLGLGVRYKWFLFEIRGETGNGMARNYGIKSTVNRIYFLLGFRFL